MEPQVSLVGLTQPSAITGAHIANELVAYAARVSNPENQMNNETAPKLLAYLIKHEHWSPFEIVSVTMEIKTTRDIGRQILRHRSFSFQEFSQRYADTNLLKDKDVTIPIPEFRRQDTKNRQNSIDDLDPEVVEKLNKQMNTLFSSALSLYNQMLEKGVAKECARFVLPLATPTRIYMTGSARSWIHYINLRSGHGTQKEHMDIANECKSIFVEQFPSVAEAMEWE